MSTQRPIERVVLEYWVLHWTEVAGGAFAQTLATASYPRYEDEIKVGVGYLLRASMGGKEDQAPPGLCQEVKKLFSAEVIVDAAAADRG